MRLNASPDNLAKNAASLGRNSYNKSVPHACWLVRRCDALLRERDERAAASSSHKRITEELQLTPRDQMKTHNSP